MSKWKFFSCWMGALAASTAIAAPSIVQPDATDLNQATGDSIASPLVETIWAENNALIGSATRIMPPRTLRANPPVPGGGCQAVGDFTNLVTGGTAVGYLLAATANGLADNFRTTSAASPTISQITWTATGRVGTTTFVDSPAFTSFTITVYNDAGGLPGTPVVASEIVTGANLTNTNAGTVVVGGVTLTQRDYFATLQAPIALNPNTCYWIEIRPTSFVTNQQYIHRPSNQGDGSYWARTTPTFLATGVASGDLNFCFNIPIASVADGLTCPLASGMSCYTSPSFNTCQVWDGTGSGQSAHIVGGADFRLADNFTLATAQSITGVCFLGFYGGTLAVPSPETFRVRFFPDGPTAGVPNDASPLLELTLTTGVPGPNGETITRGTAAIAGSTRAFNYSVDFGTNPLLLQPGCYWLEIQNQSSTTVPWFWLNKANARTATIADSYRQQRNNATTPAYGVNTQVFSGDLSWCLQGVSVVRSTTCLPAPAQPNTACTTAITLTLGAAPRFGHNLAEGLTIPFACGSRVPNFNGLWYRVVGNGQDITISTCNTGTNPLAAATDFDSVISVYCTRGTGGVGGTGTECTSGLVCIGTNDDGPVSATGTDDCLNAPGVGASSITFPTVAGQSYLVYVYGFEAGNGVIDTGFFYVSATASGTPSSPPAVACSLLNNCTIDIPAGAIQEFDACGVTSTNSNCGGAVALPLGSFGTGQVNNNGATRDFDFWRLPDVNDASGSQWFKIDYRSEFPGILQVGRGICTGTTVPLIQFAVTACSSANDFYINVPNGEFYLNISVNSFDGLPCFVGGAGNRYWLQVTPVAEVGACCLGATCTVTVRNNAATGGAEPFDCATLQGVFIGNATLCIPEPCDPAGGNPPNSVVGSCCLGFGDCTITVETGCTGGTFLAAGVCTPNTCAAPVVTCCFATGTCLISADAAACTSAGGTVQAVLRACTPNACPAPTGACCTTTFTCSITTQAACTGGATWLGANSVCTPVNCAPTGGCCATNFTCITATEAACTNAGSTWLGAGVACAATNCGPLGACCTASGVCSITTEFACATPSTWQNGILSCTPTNPCAPATIVCCRGVTCAVIAPDLCTAPAGVGVRPVTGTTCDGQSAINAGCCYADFNKSNVKDVADIFAFLSAWFADSPFSDVGGDGTGTRDVSDIFQFLSAWFAGCT